MARSRIRSRGTGLSLDVDLDELRRPAVAFRDVRRQIARDFDQTQAVAAERTVLPDARQRAGRYKVEGESVGPSLIVRRARRGPYLTTVLRGQRGRAVGLLEFGGTVRKVILPKRKKALTVNGQPVAVVRTPRHYEARHFMQDAAHARLSDFGDEVRDLLVDVFGGQGFEIR